MCRPACVFLHCEEVTAASEAVKHFFSVRRCAASAGSRGKLMTFDGGKEYLHEN